MEMARTLPVLMMCSGWWMLSVITSSFNPAWVMRLAAGPDSTPWLH